MLPTHTKEGLEIPTKIITDCNQNGIRREITDPKKIQNYTSYWATGRFAYLDQIAEKYKDTRLLSGEKPHNAQVIPAVKNTISKGKRLLITEFGGFSFHQPAFYEVDMKTNTWKERPWQKKNDYFVCNFGGKQLFMYSLSCMAFVENPDPDNLCVADHINDYEDNTVLYQTNQLYNCLKIYSEKNNKVWMPVDPTKISAAPNNLQWLSRGDNNLKGRGKGKWSKAKESQNLFKNSILDGWKWLEDQIRDKGYEYEEIEMMKDMSQEQHRLIMDNKISEAIFHQEHSWEANAEENQERELEIEFCLDLGEENYLEHCLIFDELQPTPTRIPEDYEEYKKKLKRGDLDCEEIGLSPLEFIEKYVARCHMDKWDDTMRKDVVEWVRWVCGGGHSEELPKLKVIGHKDYGPTGEWLVERPTVNCGGPYTLLRPDFDGLFYKFQRLATGLHCNEKQKERIIKQSEKRKFKIALN
jgi:hypothetical protein